MTHLNFMKFFKKKSITTKDMIQKMYNHPEFMACIDSSIYVVTTFELPLDNGWYILKGCVTEMMINNKHLSVNTKDVCFNEVFFHFYYERYN